MRSPVSIYVVLSVVIILSLQLQAEPGDTLQKNGKNTKEKKPVCRILLYSKKSDPTVIHSYVLNRFMLPETIELTQENQKKLQTGSKLALKLEGIKRVIFDAVYIETEDNRIEPERVVVQETLRDYTKETAVLDKWVADISGQNISVNFTRDSLKYVSSARIVIALRTGTDADSRFHMPAKGKWFTWKKNQRTGYLQIDGKLNTDDKIPSVFCKIPAVSVSGHPDGMIFVYLFNDFDHIYIAVDYTPDNTFAGDDSIQINIRENGDIKDICPLIKKEHIQKGFTSTKNASYPHRYYEVKIPIHSVTGMGGSSLQMNISVSGVDIL